jgi:hypothetical protein
MASKPWGNAMRLIIVILILMLAPSRADAQQATPYTILELATHCRGLLQPQWTATYEAGLCLGTFRMVQALTVLQIYNSGQPVINACPPDAVGVPDMINAFVRWSDGNPERSREPAAIGAWTAIMDTYPCRRQ